MIYLNLGRRELGKTTLARYFGRQRSPRLTIDPRAQWRDDSARYHDATETTLPEILETLERGRDVTLQPYELQEAIDRLSVVPKAYFDDDDDRRELTITFDEAGMYNLRAWSWIMRASPRDRTSIILTAHRPKDISPDIRALADMWCIFRMTQARDLEVVEEHCGSDVREEVQSLQPYEFVAWNDAKATYEIIKKPESWNLGAEYRGLSGEAPAARRARLWE